MSDVDFAHDKNYKLAGSVRLFALVRTNGLKRFQGVIPFGGAARVR